jgi:putative ABC transport system permease protein
MLTPRWRKVFNDLKSHKARTMLVVLSIAVGIFAVGSVSGMYFLVQRDFQASYQSVNAHSGVLYATLFDDDLLETAQRVEGVRLAEGRSAASGQVPLLTGAKAPIVIQGIPPVDKMQIDRVTLESGSPVLGRREVYLERSAQAALGLKPGDVLAIEVSEKRTREVRVAGIVHDATVAPFMLAQQVVAYAAPETIEWLGGSALYSQMMFVVEEKPRDEAHIREVAARITDKIERSGREVYITIVMRPGQHPAQSTIDSILVMMGGMGVMALFLSMFLVVNTISALLNQQVRQIGVMKAIGATSGQVAGIYLVLILSFAAAALLVAVPVSAAVAYAVALGVAQLLNVNPGPFLIPPEALALQVFVGVAVPLLAGLFPVLGGARRTVREAMTSYGLSAQGRQTWFDRVLEQVRGLPRPLLISIRNTFRRKGRLALTLFTLMLGGAIFIGVFNIRASLYEAIDITLGYVLSDVNITFQQSYRMERIQQAAYSVPGVEAVEGWGDTIAQAVRPDGTTSDQVEVISLPAGSRLIRPVLTAGRWLLPGDENAMVVGNHFLKLRPDVRVGDEVTLQVGEKNFLFRVVGTYQMAGTVLMPVLYVNYETMSRLLNQPGQVYTLRVLTDRHDAARQEEVSQALQAAFKEDGIAVGSALIGDVVTQQNRITIDILIYLLLFMATLIAVVGGLGLMGTMSMNVLERTREIGVMRSIGAVDGAIMQLVIVEGMVIGVISWVLGALLSIPIAKGLGYVLGISLVNVPLEYRFSAGGLLLWVVIVILLSAVACVLPARNAVRLTVRDVLAYE